jgi:hypothetical protein
LELFFRFDLSASDKTNDYEIVHQKAKVVRIDEKTDIGAYQISCQFLHPDKNTMDLIRKATQSKELKDAFSNAELIDTVDEYNQ